MLNPFLALESVDPSPGTSLKKKRRFRRRYFLLAILIIGILLSLPEYFHVNKGTSRSVGSVREGELENGWLMPHKGNNFHYFSGFSYYILDNAYVHSSVHNTLLQAYKTCETSCPGTKFILMECSDETGGQMWFHWTHQNGTSVDFMMPKKNKNSKTILSNYAGLTHYLFQFSPDGKFYLNRNTEIDFDAMAKHLLALDDAAKQNDLRIRKILFHTSMHEELFSTPAGQELKARELRFIPHLNDLINRFHDDHYHVDFEFPPDPRRG